MDDDGSAVLVCEDVLPYDVIFVAGRRSQNRNALLIVGEEVAAHLVGVGTVNEEDGDAVRAQAIVLNHGLVMSSIRMMDNEAASAIITRPIV